MTTTGLVKWAGALVALAICTACSGAFPFGSTQGKPAQSDMAVSPSTPAFGAKYVGRTLYVNGSPVTAARLSPIPRFATLVPDLHRHHTKFEYVISFYGSYASVFDYPKSTQQVGSIYGAGGQGCTNVLYGYGRHIIWNPGRTNDLINEYQVGSNKLLRSLTLNYTYTSSCAMNASGDLAVGILLGNSSGSGGQVVIFKNASGSGTVYNTPLSKEYFDGYDPGGDLFADGFAGSGFGLVELPKGSTKFESITTSNSVNFPGSVQWDGTYLTVFDQTASATYRYTVSGTKATLKGTVQYTGAGDCAQTWIVKGLIYCGDAYFGGEVFKYPAGGTPVATFSGNFDEPLGVVAAEK